MGCRVLHRLQTHCASGYRRGLSSIAGRADEGKSRLHWEAGQDYRYLSAAVMENEAQASSEQGAGTLIRTAALGRFPRRER
ncbi:hypothetical protein EYF80_017552 [Liparis tanakae]|uniref:Uncharacterized protein n=1 Tax=Liparis tanakae TaxID=230148 RepID=A0A4Z2I2V7_9TELE|nr:hypothetical protein EYF80_017552 [Liparis tanakae]